MDTDIPPSWTASAQAGGTVSNDWLKSFQDPRLDAIVHQAIARNLDLRQAADRVEAARQIVGVVGSRLKPQIGGNFGANTLRAKDQDSNFNSNREIVSVSWELDVWGRLRAQRAAAQAGYQATALDYAYARQSLAATSVKAWYQAIATRRLLAINEQAVRVYKELLRLATVKQAAGQVAQLDVAEAGAKVYEAESQLRETQSLLSEEQRALEVLIGNYPAAALDVNQDLPPPPPAIAAGLPSTLLERRPDLVAAERLVLAAFRTHEAARLAFLPTFTLSADGGRLYDEALSVLRSNPWFYLADIGMKVPFYTGGALRAELKISDAHQQRALAAYGSAVLNAFREVENALTNENLYGQRLKFEEDALRERTEAVRLATIKYQNGAIDLLPVLQLQTDALAVESEAIRLRNAVLANRINLHLALGGSFDSAPAATVK